MNSQQQHHNKSLINVYGLDVLINAPSCPSYYDKTSGYPDISIFLNRKLLSRKDSLSIDNAYLSKKDSFISNIENGKKISYRTLNDHHPDDLYLKLLTHPMAFCMFQRGSYILHASALSINNKAYLFIGPSTIGKSFLVGSLLKHGKFITEDIARINLEKVPTIYKGPPIIKLSSDFFKMNNLDYESSFSVRSDLRDRFGYVLNKSLTSETKTHINACFIINPSETNSITEINKEYAFKNLLFNSFSNLPRSSCLHAEKALHLNLSKFLDKVDILQFNRANVNYDKYLLDYIDKKFK